MKRYSGKGTITVFLSLVSTLLLSLLCTATESARIQGSRAKAAAALDMGIFSVFGEFEREALEKYDVFFLDGAQGSGEYSQEKPQQKLQEYMEYNVSPNRELLFRGFDPFGLELKDASVTAVQLATDENGAAFYQQAVGFMKENLATEAINAALTRAKKAEELEKAGKDYEEQEAGSDTRLADLQKQQAEEEKRVKEAQEAAQNSAQDGGEAQEAPAVQEEQKPAVKPEKNPLEVIKKIKRKGLLGLLIGDKVSISEKKLPSDAPSKRHRKKGTIPVEKKHSGLVADLIFQEYLFERFSLFTDEQREGSLDYALEYILCGKNTDKKNLKSVVTRLLLLREGANFVHLTGDPAKKGEADALAALLVGAIPVPGLLPATSYALQLVWAYGESLLDVRTLLLGGKVPLFKESGDWKLGLGEIPQLLEILEGTDVSDGAGVSYSGYLQMLFTLGNQKKYPMRALDMIEGYLKTSEGTENFRADHAICKMEAKASFVIPPLFLKVSSAFLKTGTTQTDYEASASFGYY